MRTQISEYSPCPRELAVRRTNQPYPTEGLDSHGRGQWEEARAPWVTPKPSLFTTFIWHGVCACACVLYSCECRYAHVEAKGNYWFTLFFERYLILLENEIQQDSFPGHIQWLEFIAQQVLRVHPPVCPLVLGLHPPHSAFIQVLGIWTQVFVLGQQALYPESPLQFLPGYFSPVSKQDHPLAQSGLVKEPKQVTSVMIQAGMNILWRDAVIFPLDSKLLRW